MQEDVKVNSLRGASLCGQIHGGTLPIQASRESEIPRELYLIDSQLQATEGLIGSLMERLAPAMSNESIGSGAEKAPALATQMGARLSTYNARIRSVNDLLREILERLEL